MKNMMQPGRYGPLVIIPLVLITGLLLLSRLFMLIRIQETSMEPTFCNGEVVLVKRIRKPERLTLEYGDVVIYKKPHSGELVIKRVILPTRAPLKIDHGWLCAGGRKYFLKKTQRDTLLSEEQLSEENTSGPDFFAVGDNQFHSLDSREYGFVPYRNIVGVVPGRKKVIPVNEQ